MKLLNLFFVCSLVFWGTTALADPPACPVEQGVCFEPITGVVWFFGEDLSGAYLEAAFEADHNDFDRLNNDGTIFTHMVAKEIIGGFYCPPGSLIPDECWPIEPSMPSGGSVTGIIIVDPPWFYFACPYRALGHAYVRDLMGNLYKSKTLLVSAPSPEGGCDFVKFEIRVKPMR